jgi:hypothetical protein
VAIVKQLLPYGLCQSNQQVECYLMQRMPELFLGAVLSCINFMSMA